LKDNNDDDDDNGGDNAWQAFVTEIGTNCSAVFSLQDMTASLITCPRSDAVNN